METDAKEKDNDGNEPKRIKLENESADTELEDSQNWKPQLHVQNFRCHKCPDNFATREEIIHHWTELHGLHPSNCSVCNAHFPSIMEMFDHKVAIHGIPCEICESFFETEEKLSDHVKCVHLNDSNLEDNGKRNFEDTKDNQDVKSTEYFEDGAEMTLTLPTNGQAELELEPKLLKSQPASADANSKVPAVENPSFTCHLCPKIFRKTRDIKHHWKKIHGLKPAECNLCKKLFPSKRLLASHKKEEHGIVCEICNKSFSGQNGLEEHVREIHEVVRQTSCTVCGLIFPLELDLKHHVIDTHSDIPGSIARCDVCQYVCLTEDDLINHRGKHVTTTCYECKTVFPSKGAAKRHGEKTKHTVTLKIKVKKRSSRRRNRRSKSKV